MYHINRKLINLNASLEQKLWSRYRYVSKGSKSAYMFKLRVPALVNCSFISMARELQFRCK